MLNSHLVSSNSFTDQNYNCRFDLLFNIFQDSHKVALLGKVIYQIYYELRFKMIKLLNFYFKRIRKFNLFSSIKGPKFNSIKNQYQLNCHLLILN